MKKTKKTCCLAGKSIVCQTMLKGSYIMFSKKDYCIVVLMMLILVMGKMDITPGEALQLTMHTLPNYLKFKLSFIQESV